MAKKILTCKTVHRVTAASCSFANLWGKLCEMFLIRTSLSYQDSNNTDIFLN